MSCCAASSRSCPRCRPPIGSRPEPSRSAPATWWTTCARRSTCRRPVGARSSSAGQVVTHLELVEEMAAALGRRAPRMVPASSEIARPETVAAGVATVTPGMPEIAAEISLGLTTPSVVSDRSGEELFSVRPKRLDAVLAEPWTRTSPRRRSGEQIRLGDDLPCLTPAGVGDGDGPRSSSGGDYPRLGRRRRLGPAARGRRSPSGCGSPASRSTSTEGRGRRAPARALGGRGAGGVPRPGQLPAGGRGRRNPLRLSQRVCPSRWRAGRQARRRSARRGARSAKERSPSACGRCWRDALSERERAVGDRGDGRRRRRRRD